MLVLDTAITKAFCEVLEVLEPSKEIKILPFVIELLKNARAYERRIDTLNEEIARLMEQLEVLEDKPVEQTEEPSPYSDDDEEESDED